MNVFAFILLLIAAVCFGIEWFRSQWQSLTALGLCLLAVGLIAEFAGSTHTINF